MLEGYRVENGVCVCVGEGGYLSVWGRELSDDMEHMEPKILWQDVGVASDLSRSPSVELLRFRPSTKLLESRKEPEDTDRR